MNDLLDIFVCYKCPLRGKQPAHEIPVTAFFADWVRERRVKCPCEKIHASVESTYVSTVESPPKQCPQTFRHALAVGRFIRKPPYTRWLQWVTSIA